MCIAILHFLLPFGIFCTVSTNSSLSRPLIAIYCTALCTATMAGQGYLGGIETDPVARAVVSAITLLAALAWLYGSPKMRVYYTLLSGRPIPDDLRHGASAYPEGSWLGARSYKALGWLADNLETVVLLGFTVIALYAFIRTGT